MTMFDVPRHPEAPSMPPMLVVGIGAATEDCLAEEGLEIQAPDLHLLKAVHSVGNLALASARRYE